MILPAMGAETHKPHIQAATPEEVDRYARPPSGSDEASEAVAARDTADRDRKGIPDAAAGPPQPMAEPAGAGTADTGVCPPASENEAAGAGELERLRGELKDYKDRYLRAQAECRNVARRLTEEKESVVRYAHGVFAKSLLPVLDSLEQTLAYVPKDQAGDTIHHGVKLVHDMFRKALAEHGVEPIESVGRPFDPSRHEAMQRQETREHPEGTVIAEYQRGYTLRDRVLRASKVVVAVAPSQDAKPGSAGPANAAAEPAGRSDDDEGRNQRRP